MASHTIFFLTFYLLAVFLVNIFLLINVEGDIFDVSSFGAISGGNSDITTALQKAWSEACKGTNSNSNTVLVPKGNYTLNIVAFSGPCKGNIIFQVDGILTAPAGTSTVGQWVMFSEVKGLTITGHGTFDGQGQTIWNQDKCKYNCDNRPLSIKFDKVTDSLIEGITSLNSKFFHIMIDESDNIEIKSVNIIAPADSPNTDGIHVSRSKRVKIHNSNINTGDDCISIVWGSQDVHVYEVNCGPGHGISIGSIGKYENEGDVSGILVEKCNLTSTTNGLRIKTWAPSYPSKVYNVNYTDIILQNVGNPILIDQHYCPHLECQPQGESNVEISNVKYENIRGSSNMEVSVSLDCSKSKPCNNFQLLELNILTGQQQPTNANCTNCNGQFVQSQSPNRCG